MTVRDELWIEWDRAYHQCAPDHLAHLMKHGVAPSVLVDALVGIEKIEVEGELYHPSGDGAVVVIMPVVEWTPDGPYLNAEGFIHPDGPPAFEPILVDLVAWRLRDPERWWFRRGEPALMLGRDNLEVAAWLESPIKVFRTPLGWLRNGCRGVVLINRNGLESAFIGVRHLDAEDLEHGRELRDWLHTPPPILSEIRVPINAPKEFAA